jgi:hypothetical protein
MARYVYSKQRGNVLVILCMVFAAVLAADSPSCAQGWQELKGEHFIVNYLQDKQFAEEVLNKAEHYYENIAYDLGYPRNSEFWTWEKRVKVNIYNDRKSFLKATGQPEWSYGVADYIKKEIAGFAFSQGFLASVLPHEIAHLIFRDFVGFKGEVPLWLDEGVAQWAELNKRNELKAFIKSLYENDGLLSLSDMMKLDIRNLKQMDRVYVRSVVTKNNERGVLFLSTDNLLNTYYAQSVSLVGFLIERFGVSDFAHFCRQLRDGKSLQDALVTVYPAHIRSLDDFELQWREYIGKM